MEKTVRFPLRPRRLLALLVSLLMLAQVFYGLPAPGVSGSDTTYAAGSLIIPMDTAYQNMGMWKAYGLLYALLQAGVPVHWAIKDPKTFNGVDFAATAKDLRTNAPVGTPNYSGGPFIVASADTAKALPVIQAWWLKYPGLPVVHQATADFVANVDLVLKNAPRIANEAINGGISIAYYNAAGIPDDNGKVWTLDSPNILDQTEIANGALFERGECSRRDYDIFVTPHNSGYTYSLTDPTNLGTRTYAQLDYFLHQGGGWLALCHSMMSNERAIEQLYNYSSPSVRAMFHSTVNGGLLAYTWPNQDGGDNVGGTWVVNKPTLPVAQAVATTVAQALPGGSWQSWLTTKPNYYPQTERVAYYRTAAGLQYDMFISGVPHNGSTLGKASYLGGHSYSTAVPYSTNFEAPYLRFFYNSLFFNGSAVSKLDISIYPPRAPVGQTQVGYIELKNVGGSVAQSTDQVQIKLAPGVTYLGMEIGPEPIVSGDVSTGIILYWGNTIGSIAPGQTALKIRGPITPTSVGEFPILNFESIYGDVFLEQFAADQCRSVEVYPAPVAEVTKTPAAQSVYSGTPVTWNLNYRNSGSAVLYNAVVEDILPAGFGFKSSTPALSYPPVLLPDGTTRLRWNVGTLTGGAAAQSISLTVYSPHVNDPASFTNHVSLVGYDADGIAYHDNDQAEVTLTIPPVDLAKSVAPSGAVDVTDPGQVLTYTLRPQFHDDFLLQNVLISDAVPAYTSYITGSVSAGGSYGFTPVPKVDGVDTDTFASPRTTTVAVTASPTVVKTGDTINVTMTVTNNSGVTISNIVPSLDERMDAGVAVISPPSVSGFTLNNGASQTVTFTCTLNDIGERLFIGSADGIVAGEDYSFVDGYSNTLLSLSRLNASPSGDVVTWRLGSNTSAADGTALIGSNAAGIYAFYGNDKTFFYRYDVTANTWAARQVAPGTVKEGGSLAYDGGGYVNGYIYALRGDGSNAFWRYDIDANTWLARANTPANVKNGGALVWLNGYAYALGGNGTKNFWRYDPTANSWTATGVMANTPQNVKDGGALTTDGTYIYAFRGDRKADFWRYNVSTNTWTVMAPAPANIGQGGALVYRAGYIYALRGDGKNSFYRYNIAANTWSAMAVTPANVKAGGALTTDGTYIYATQGNNQTGFWRYNPATNTWSVMAVAAQPVGWGGALAYVPSLNLQYRKTALTVDHSLVTTGDQITLTMTLNSSVAETNVIPGTPTVTGTNGASAALVSGPTLVSADNNITDINDPVVYQWVYSTAAGTIPGSSVRFSAAAAGTTPPSTFPTGTSQSVLVSPVLTFQARVFGAGSLPANVTEITNVGMYSDNSPLYYGVESKGVVTPLKRSNLSLTKANSPDENQILDPGDEVTYTLVLKNDGTGTASNIVVTDAVPPYTTYVPGSAVVTDDPDDPGRTMTVTEPSGGNPLRIDISQLKLDETVTVTFKVKINIVTVVGSYHFVNTASAYAAGVSSFNSNTVTNYFDVDASFEISKFASTDKVYDVGETVEYEVYLVNTGNIPLSSVTVTDPLVTNLAYASGDDNGDSKLDLYEQWLYTGTYTILPSDVGSDGYGLIVNTATGDTAETGPKSAQADVEIELAHLNLVKANDPGESTVMAPGDEITYTLTLQTAGQGTAHNIVVTDAVPPGTTYVPGSAQVSDDPDDPGRSILLTPPAGANPLTVNVDYLGYDETVTVIYRVTIDRVAMPGSYQIDNTASAVADYLDPTASNTVTNHFDAAASFNIVKIADPVLVHAIGETINYYVYLTNTGNMPLTSVTVDDPLVTNLTYVSGDVNFNMELDLDEEWLYTGTYVVQPTDVDENGDGVIVNVATADTNETLEKTATANVTVDLLESRLRISKEVEYAPGSGYGPADADTVFMVRVRSVDDSYAPDVLLKAGETVEMTVPYGEYEISEPAVPLEYTRTSAYFFPIINGIPGTPEPIGPDNIVNVNTMEAEAAFTNTFEHVTYFHHRDTVNNTFTPS